MSKPIPIHLVCGPLGVGKTTAVLSYIERNAGLEHVAVLVNDFGPIGMDGAIMQGAIGKVVGDQMKVLTIPGGCMCCASADAMATSIPKLLEVPGVTRIIIEPSGVAMPGQMVDLVRSLAKTHPIELGPTIVILDAAEFRSEVAERMPYYQRLVESADVLVANRIDKATEKSLDQFRSWAQGLYPPKLRVITTTMGELPDEVFALTPQAVPAHKHHQEGGHDHHHDHGHHHDHDHAHHHDHDHDHGHHHEHAHDDHGHHHHHDHEADEARAGGLQWEPEVKFQLESLRKTILDLPIERFKGIFNTEIGWKLIELARGDMSERFTEHRRDSRCDWIAPEPDSEGWASVINRIQACKAESAS